ncbi:MAG: hypothetical protein ACOZDY_01955 [Pseudomonadota bacterium]
MKRQEMIDRLVEAARVATARDESGAGLGALLREGFIGFEKMSEASLRRELQFRGLLDYDEPELPEADDGESTETELMVLLSGMTGNDPTLHFFD